MDWVNKIINSKSKVKKSDAEMEYDYEALFGENPPDSSTNNPENMIEVNLDLNAESTTEVENELDDEMVSSAVVDSGEISEHKIAPEDRTFELTEKEIEDIVSVISNECILSNMDKIDDDTKSSESSVQKNDESADLERDILETAISMIGCKDEARIRKEFERLRVLIQALALDPVKETDVILMLADALKIEVDGIEMVGLRQSEIEEDDFPEYENLDEVEVDPSSGFEEEPFVSNDLENLETEIGENPNSLERWMQMGDALNDGIIDVDDRPFSPADFEPEVSRFGSAIRWTDGLANPILWTIENDWTQRELSTIKNFVGKVAVAVRNRGVLLDSDNIMMMAETISAENVGRTMFMLSEPWMSRTKLNLSDAMNLAGKLAPKICDSLKFETLSSAGLSEAFAKTRDEFEDKLGTSTRSEIQHVVQVIRSLKTPLAYTMATSLDYVCACLGDRAAMVRISDAIQTLLDDDMIEPEAIMLDMAHVADNWRRLAHAQYLDSDNSFEAFEQRFAIEAIDLTGKKGKIEFDSRVILSEPSDELMELCVGISALRGAHIENVAPVDTKQNVKEASVIATDVSKAAEDLSPSDQEFFDQIAKEYSDSGSVSISMEPDLILTDTGGDGTRIRVLDRIAGSDGNSSAERNYGHLLRPLPILPAPDPDKLYSELMAEFPWMAEINEEVARAAAISTRHIGKCFTIPPMLLNGPSGVGKTRWVRRVAQLSSIPIHFISVAGSDSSKSIMGSERGWSNARPSLPVLALSSTQVVNPIIMVDELDKANASTNGDPFAALLPMLASETNATYPDAYLLGAVNLSYASFIFTANSISKLGTPLLDRIDVFNVSPPSNKDYPVILRGMIIESAQNACIDAIETEALMEQLLGNGMDCLARGDSLRKVERAINGAVAKYIWKPKSHLTLVK